MSAAWVDDAFKRLGSPFDDLKAQAERLLADLIANANLARAELSLCGRPPIRLERQGRSMELGRIGAGGAGRRRAARAIPDERRARPLEVSEWFDAIPPEDRIPVAPTATFNLPLTFGARSLGELRLVWPEAADRHRVDHAWLDLFARQLGFLVHRHDVRDWAARRLGQELLLVGTSREMRRLDEQLDHAAVSDLPVMLAGEFGTEKLPLAVAVHCGGTRRDGPFVSVNCADPVGTPADWFELAHQGTLYLNGIEHLPPGLQRQIPQHMPSHLGQWVVNGEVPDVRIIAATSGGTAALSERQDFLRPLAAELDLLGILAPPLRDRASDMDVLIDSALQRRGFHLDQKGSEALLAACRAYHWPENVLELDRVITRLAVMTGHRRITLDDIRNLTPWMPVAEERQARAPRSLSTGRPDADELWLRCAVHRESEALQSLHEGLSRALTYLGDHYAEPMSLARLARHARVSESHVGFLFRTVMGMPFKSVLGRIRIHRAMELLAADHRRQITDVALSVGFSDLSHFEKSFRRYAGQSPSAFRKSCVIRSQGSQAGYED